jgi:drug/metabolite transporter (DMT)-like permease
MEFYEDTTCRNGVRTRWSVVQLLTTQTTRRSRPLAGGLMVLASALLFAGVGALVKVLSIGLPTEVIVFFRNAVAAVFLLPWLRMRHRGLSLKTNCLHLHLLRAAAGLGAMYCFFIALKLLRLADAMLLCYTLPIFIPIFEGIQPGPCRAGWAFQLRERGFCRPAGLADLG